MMQLSEFETLLNNLNESAEHLRTMEVQGDQQNVDLVWAFHRITSAAAAIRALLAENGKLRGI